jgi:hypothetical protein
MEITARELWTILHGMGFGALFMMAFSGALAQLFRISAPGAGAGISEREQALLAAYLAAMVALAWLTVLSGAYVIYPWYRAAPPAGVTDLTAYPRLLLISSSRTSEWHNIGMEWKEHVAWFAPIAMTMVASVTMTYRRSIVQHRQLRAAVLGFALAAFLATGVAGVFGALLNKVAPVRGGEAVAFMHGKS